MRKRKWINKMYDELNKLALKLLNIALKYDVLYKYLGGSTLYSVKTRDTMGNKVQATGVVMEAIYEKYT